MGRLAGGVKLKGKLTLEFDKELDLESLLPLLTQSQPQPFPTPQAQTSLESLLPLFPQPYLLPPSERSRGRSRKFDYQSPDKYPVSGGLINKGEGVSVY